MILPYANDPDNLAYSIVRFDGKIRNLRTQTWEAIGTVPTADQMGPFTRVAATGIARGQQIADIPGIDGNDFADDARLYGCSRFNGLSYYIISSSAPCVAATKTFTWACWFRRKGVAVPNATLVGEGSSTSPTPLFQLRADDITGTHMGIAFRDNAGTLVTIRGAKSIDDAAWHHVAVTCDGSTLTLYVDGAADGTASVTGLGAIAVDRLCFGALCRASVVCQWTGDLDDVRSYARALSAADVSAAARRWLCGTSYLDDVWVSIWTLDAVTGAPKALSDVVPLNYLTVGGPMPGGTSNA
jgi:hypothetical protein